DDRSVTGPTSPRARHDDRSVPVIPPRGAATVRTAHRNNATPRRSQMSNQIPFDVSFNFVPRAKRPEKPRSHGITEIRAPYYSTFGTRHLQDVMEVAGQWVDGIKWAGGSFALVPPEQVRRFSE